MWRRVSVLLALAGALLLPASAGALTLDPIGTFSSPVYVASDPEDPGRLFVVEQAGRIQLLDHGAPQTTFLDIRDIVRSSADNAAESERGLLSMAFAPDFNDSGLFYVFYTREGAAGAERGDLQVDEFEAAVNTADPGTRRPVLTIEHTQNSNHNGGQLQTGPDGLLYISTGDGGGAGDPGENGQDLNELLGKILRIDPAQDGADPYTIPSDNPFVGEDDGARDEIWSYGLRNPWRFSFDRLTGDLLIGDVGQAAWEEVDYAVAPDAGKGLNFGWDCREGRHDFELLPPPACSPPFTEPIFEYANPGSTCASVTGGYVVRDPSLGDLVGRYLVVDLCAGTIGSFIPGIPDATEVRSEMVREASSPSSFGEDACGRLYLAELGGGAVSRFTGDAPADCGSTLHRLTVSVAGDGEGSVTASGIDCPDDCLGDYEEGTEVTLTATPDGDSTFAGWGGDCSGSAACVVTMDSNRSVTASFDAAPEPEPLPNCGGEEATMEAEPDQPLVGTQGADIIAGSADSDFIRSLGGDDVVCGRGGSDALVGLRGSDLLKGGKGQDRLLGGRGPDHLAGGSKRDRCRGGPGRDTTESCS